MGRGGLLKTEDDLHQVRGDMIVLPGLVFLAPDYLETNYLVCILFFVCSIL